MIAMRLPGRLSTTLRHSGASRSPEGADKLDSGLRRNDYAEISAFAGRRRLCKTISRLPWFAGLAILALALLLGACATDAGSEPLQSDEMSAAASATPAQTEQAAPAAADAAADTGSTASTAATSLTGAPAARITDIRFGKHDDFERLVIDFATDEESARAVPHWRIEKAAGEGVVRIHLPTTTETAFTDAQLADKFTWFTHVYVVRAPDRSLFVDVFIPGAYQLRVQELRNPLRLAIDVAPGGTETYVLPATTEHTVLIAPRPGANIHGTLTVSGYSRHFEGNNVIILQDSAGNEIARAVTTATDYIETWGYFATQLTVPAGTGTGMLLVGDFDAKDGEFEGVTIPVQFGGP